MDRRILGKCRQLGFDRGQDPETSAAGRRKFSVEKTHKVTVGMRELGAPFEDLVELVGAQIIDRARLDDAERAAMAAVAVENDADMTRPRAASDIAGEPAGVKIIEEPEHRP